MSYLEEMDEIFGEPPEQEDTPHFDVPETLVGVLQMVFEIDERLSQILAEQKSLKSKREHLENVAVAKIQDSGLDGVKSAGRQWRVEPEHHLSVTADNRDAVMALARQREGWAESIAMVNTLRLRALLKEEAQKRGSGSDEHYTEGTEFSGFVSEYVKRRLRHRKV